jgi:hypothetical protein
MKSHMIGVVRYVGAEIKIKYLLLLITAFSLIAFPGAPAAAPASPAVEVKFFLKPHQVLDTNRRPNDALRTVFGVPKETKKKPVKIRMQFLDGPNQELHHEGWNIRLRKVQGQDHIELTFKRRYHVDDSLETVLAKAAQDGLDARSTNEYASELEWGYDKQTVTYANQKRAGDAEEQSLALPSAADAQDLVAKKLPAKLQQWKDDGWAKRVLSGACLYGPVDGWRWQGSHAKIDDKIAIEVWALPTADGIGTEHVVEISFKKNKYDRQVTGKRQKLLKILKKKGWLLENDVLKTTLILERSRQPNC